MQWMKRVFGETVRRQQETPGVQPTLIMALEPRMMFDGAVAASVGEAAKPTDTQDAVADKGAAATHSKDSDSSHAAATGDVRSSDAGQGAQAGSGRNVVFVDSRVEDAKQLLQGVAANTDVVFLDRNGNGVQQMAQYLAAHPGAASVQIIAHGNAGDLWLGNSYVSAENIADYGASLNQLGANMQAGGDILVYACSTAQGERGQTFVDELASLTGRDVAASNDRTGAGSDWDLEVTTGNIEARSVLSQASEAAYGHDLAIITVTSNADSGAGTLRNAIASAQAGDTITFSSAMTVNLSSGQLSIGKSLTIEGDIDGNGTADVTIDAHQTSRVLVITTGTVKLDGLVLTGGLLSGNGGDYNSVNGKDALGAGLAVTGGTVTLTHSSVTANAAAGGGGNGGGAGYGYGGGGGGGFNGVGGARGGNYSPAYAGQSGGSGVGGRGGFYVGISNGVNYVGKGGNTNGGTGGAANTGFAAGGSGGRAGSAGSGYIGGGGAGSGASLAASVGTGGNAAGGIYIASGATLYVATTSITKNLGAGGGGAGSSYSVAGANGGIGVGGILNKGTLHYDSTSVNLLSGQQNYGQGGAGGGAQHGQATGSAGSGTNTGNENLTTAGAGTVDSSWSPDIAPTNTTSGGTTAFIEGNNTVSTPVVVDSGFTVSDPDNTSLASATVSVTGNFHSAEDVLSFTNNGSTMGNIVGSYNSATGVLTLTSAGASATLAQWQAALRSVTYTDTSDTPNTSSRTISFVTNDGTRNSNSATKTVSVTALNDTPIATASGGSTAYVEGNNVTASVAVDSGITVSDLDSTSLASATVSITGGFRSAEDVLSFTNNGSTMGNIVGSYNSATGVLTLTSAGGSATLAQWQTALRAVTYSDTSDTPDTGNRTVSFTVNDGSSDSAVTSKTLTVASTDDTPVVTTSGGTTAFVEGNNATSTPVVVDSGITVNDLDNPTLSSATVAITGNFHSAEDVLAFSNDGSTMGDIVGSYNAATGLLTLTSAGSATLAQWQAALRAVTYTNSSESPNTATRTLSFAANDGTATGNAATRTVGVTSVDDTPIATASGGATAASENLPAVIDAGLVLSDLDNTTLASATVSITSNFHIGEDVLAFSNDGSTMGNILASYNATTGVLTLTSASASATLAQWQAALRSVTYTDTSDAPNTADRSVSFTVYDGTTNSLAATKTVSVTAVNDAPLVTASGGSAAFVAGDNSVSTPVAIDSGITLSDPDNTTLASAAVAITGNFHSGEDVLSFTNNGSTMGNITASYNAATGILTLTSASASATLAQWQAALRSVTYTDTAITPNTSTRTISFTVNDGAADSVATSRTVTVAATDQTPILATSGGTSAFTEGDNVASTPVVIDAGLTVSDLDNGTLASAIVAVTGNFQSGEDVLSFTNNGSTMGNIVGSYNAATGILTLTSAGANATLAQWQAALRAVTYTDTSDSPNTGNRSIGFSVNDGSKDSAPVTRTVSVTAVNDTPVLGVDSGSAAFVAGDNTASTPVAIDSGITISDLDNTSLASATISITGNFHPGEDVLSFVNDGSTMGNIAASFNAATGVLTLTSAGASATLAQWQAALRSATYTDTAVTPNTATRTVSFQVNDGTDGSNVGTRTITVSAVDQTPIVTAGSGSSVFTKGGAPVAIDSGITVSDLDNTTLATATVAITGNFHSGEDLLAFTNSNSALFGNIVASYNVGTGVMTLSSAGATATLAQWQNALEAVTYSNGSSTPNAATRTISFAVNDGSKTSAAATHAVDVLVNPSVLSVSATTANGAYKVGDTISITVTFDQAVNVDTSGGSPTLLLETGATDRTATYQSGNGTNTLIFTYTVQAGDQSADLDFASTSALSLNGATIRNATSDDAILTLASPGAAGSLGANKAIVIDGVAPTVSSVSVPANGTYPAGGNLDFIVNYSENVTVDTSGGTPYIDVTLDTGGTVRAQYLAGSGTSALTFRLVLASGQVDSNGVSLGSSVQLNGGALRDLAGNAAVTTLNSVGSTAGVLVDGVAPTPSGIARVEAASNNATSLHYTVTFDEAVSGVDASDFTLVGTGTAAGSISSVTQIDARTYTVLIGSVSGDGTLRLDLNASGTGITDLAGNPVSGGLQGAVYTLDHTAPDVTSVAVPSNGYYRAGDLLSFTVNASEAVTVDTSGATPRLALTIGSRTVYANYVSGSGSTALVFQYQVQAGDNDADGITVGALQTNGGSLRDAVGNDAVTTLNSVGSTAAVLVDTTVPTVASVSVPAAGDYKAGALLDFTVNASEAITLNTLGGVPRLALDIGGRTVYANYVSGSGSSALVFQYQVQAGDNDADGIAVLGLDANGGSLHDVAGNALALGLNNVADPSGVQVDTRAPQVSSVTAIAAGDYKAGQVLTFTVDTDEPITLDTSGGAPRLALDIGGRTVYADYVSGSATTLQFQYQIQPGDNDADGIQILSLQSNGSTLRDAAGNDLQAGLRNVRDTSSVLVDTTAPTATTLVRANPSPSNAGTVDFDVSFSERVDGLAATSFTLQATGTASGQILSVTRLNDQTWRVTVGNVGGDGNLTLSLRADNQVQDRAGNSLQQGLQGPAYALDHSSPQVNGVQVPADGRYSVGQSLQFTVDYNEAVVVDTSGGVPRIAITLAQGGTAYANYVSGSGTQQLVFAYTVQAGQADNDGIQLGDQILTNGGRLSDAVGNAASLQLGALPSTAGVLVQGSLSDGDPQFRTDQGTRPVVIVNSGSPSNGPFVPSPLQHSGPPVLGMPPLLDSSNLGQAQSAFTSLFREAPSQSQFALIFSNASSSGHGDGAGMGFLGFGGGDAGVFATSSLSSVFDAAQQGTEEALSAFDHRGGNVFGGLHGAFAAPGLGQQLHEMNQREQRQVADLAKAFGELGQERPAS